MVFRSVSWFGVTVGERLLSGVKTEASKYRLANDMSSPVSHRNLELNHKWKFITGLI